MSEAINFPGFSPRADLFENLLQPGIYCAIWFGEFVSALYAVFGFSPEKSQRPLFCEIGVFLEGISIQTYLPHWRQLPPISADT
jgi:hypothetical protein